MKKFSFNYPYCKRKPGVLVLHIVYYRLEPLSAMHTKNGTIYIFFSRWLLRILVL